MRYRLIHLNFSVLNNKKKKKRHTYKHKSRKICCRSVLSGAHLQFFIKTLPWKIWSGVRYNQQPWKSLHFSSMFLKSHLLITHFMSHIAYINCYRGHIGSIKSTSKRTRALEIANYQHHQCSFACNFEYGPMTQSQH